MKVMQAAHNQLYLQPWISMLLISPLGFPGCGNHCYYCCYSFICQWWRLSLSLWGCNSKWCNSKHLAASSQKTMKLFMMNPWPWMQLIPCIVTVSPSGQAATFIRYCAGSTLTANRKHPYTTHTLVNGQSVRVECGRFEECGLWEILFIV